MLPPPASRPDPSTPQRHPGALSGPFGCSLPTPARGQGSRSGPVAGPAASRAARSALSLPHPESPLSPAPALPPARLRRGPRPAVALTELGDVPGHRVVLLAPVQRGGRAAPVALTVPRRSHRARRRRRPGAPLAALGSARLRGLPGPLPPRSRALPAPPRPPPRGAGPGAVTRRVLREAPPPGAAKPPRPRWRGGPYPGAPGLSCPRLPQERA